MIKEKIEKLLVQRFSPEFLEVIDESHKHAGHAGALQGGHFYVNIKSKAFDDQKLLDSHRMIYQALKPLKPLIHAISIKIQS